MEPMFTCRRALTWMYIYRADKTDWLTEISYIAFVAMIVVLNAAGVGVVLALGMKEAIFAVLNFPALSAMIYTILIAVLFLHRGIVHIFERLRHICNECKFPLRIMVESSWI